jgi:hypothetical protein
MKKYLLGLVIVIVAAVFVTVPSQALQKGEMPDRSERQAKIQVELESMRVYLLRRSKPGHAVLFGRVMQL